MTTHDVIGLVASAVFIARLTPQPLRLARSGVAEGVSPLSAFNAVIAAVAWLVYGLVADLPIVWVVSLIAVIPGVWAVVLLRRHAVLADVLWALAWVGVLVAAAAAGLLAAALGLGVVVTQGPQVWRACREHDLSGLSPITWWLSILDAVTWGAYGVAISDPALLGYAVVLSTSAVVVLARLWWTSRDRARATSTQTSATSQTTTM